MEVEVEVEVEVVVVVVVEVGLGGSLAGLAGCCCLLPNACGCLLRSAEQLTAKSLIPAGRCPLHFDFR